MKRQFWRLLLMATVMSLIFTTKVLGQDAAPQGHSVAVLPFEVDAEQFGEMGRDLQTLLTAHLSSDPQIILVERAEVDKALSELEMGISGTVDPDTAAKIGYITGAQILVTGRSFAVQKELVTVAKIVGVETSRVYGQTSTMPLRGSLVEMSVELAEKIASTINAKGNTLIAKRTAKEDIVAELRPLVEGKTLPSVSVSIPEISLAQSVPDPAAETENRVHTPETGIRDHRSGSVQRTGRHRGDGRGLQRIRATQGQPRIHQGADRDQGH